MSTGLVEIITSDDPAVRDRALEVWCSDRSVGDLLDECTALDRLRRDTPNLYERVRALFFLYAIHRFHLPPKLGNRPGNIPFRGYEHLLQRRFEEAIDTFLAEMRDHGAGDAVSSALAAAYHQLAFQTLANQVRRSVRTVRGNQWMFRMGHRLDHPLRIRPELLKQPTGSSTCPILRERTPVRMDLSHSAWSDIFFLGMDYPEGARVLNVSVDLGVHGRDSGTQPPVSAYLRVIDQPVLRLASVDLQSTAEIDNLGDVFDFASDYLGLLKAAVIASGIVPPGIEGSGAGLPALLERVCGTGRGLELVSCVNDIPKGSRLAVSTNLLAALVSVCMRATGQTRSLTGPLDEGERRVVLARALLGEWLGGSGGGWQDSGGVWPGIKLISGVASAEGDPEFGVSRGRLMPRHHVYGDGEIPQSSRQALQDSLVLVHGGLAQNVGPILEMVTEKYLLRGSSEWNARQEALGLMEEVIGALRDGDIPRLGAATTRNFEGPIQTIVPWATTYYTERLIRNARDAYGERFLGFWMLGGMSGGGMGFMFDPEVRDEARDRMQQIMSAAKRDLSHSLPFAMDPVVYDFSINEQGTTADLLSGAEALMPKGYYPLAAPALLRTDPWKLSEARREELDRFAAAARTDPAMRGMVQELFDALVPRVESRSDAAASLDSLLADNGFDRKTHEQIRSDLRAGRIGLSQNRLPSRSEITDAAPEDVVDLRGSHPERERWSALGRNALARGEVAVVTLAGGAASRWTQGAGVVKAINPFCKLDGRHRTFMEVHLAKSRRVSSEAGEAVPHVFTTGYLTHEPTAAFLERVGRYDYPGTVMLSRGRSVGLRMIPMQRDLRFAWEELPQQMLDEQQQKVRDSARNALLGWAAEAGEGNDYTDNLPLQCLHPIGHFYEFPNLLRNGTLARLLRERPALRTIMLHNIDTVGADIDAALLGAHLDSGTCLGFEVVNRRLEDRGGGLARVEGRPRLLEGLAMPREEIEFQLTYYNSMTTWIDIDRFLAVLDLSRSDLDDESRTLPAIRRLASRIPTYITLKEVKKRWGHGQEDVFPVAQFEKLWSDLTALPDVSSQYLAVSRLRGQQLKEPAQLDGWLRDGSAAHVQSLCQWSR